MGRRRRHVATASSSSSSYGDPVRNSRAGRRGPSAIAPAAGRAVSGTATIADRVARRGTSRSAAVQVTGGLSIMY